MAVQQKNTQCTTLHIYIQQSNNQNRLEKHLFPNQSLQSHHRNRMKKPKNYYCHRGAIEYQNLQTVPNIQPPFSNFNGPSTFGENFSSVSSSNAKSPNKYKQEGKRYQVVEKIGEGSFGEVYKMFDPESSQLIVLKKFKNAQYLSQQARILGQLTSSEGFENLKTSSNLGLTSTIIQPYSQQNNLNLNQSKQLGCQNSLVMACLGPPISTLLKKHKKFNIYTTKRLAYQLIQKLAQIHRKNYIHRDIKTDNILLGNKYDCHSVYLIDFGLATNFRKISNSKPKARRTMQGIVGTARYCSIASHQGLEQFPKDDLESLGYVLIYFVMGAMPWDKQNPSSTCLDPRQEIRQDMNININLNKDDQKIFEKIYQHKKSATIQDLCFGINCLRKFWTYVKNLKVGDKISYEELKSYFEIGEDKDRKGQQNCYQFCTDCWVKQSINMKIKKRQSKKRYNDKIQSTEEQKQIQNKMLIPNQNLGLALGQSDSINRQSDRSRNININIRYEELQQNQQIMQKQIIYQPRSNAIRRSIIG